MPEETLDEPTITYKLRDILDQIKLAQAQGFARIDANLSIKADKSDIDRLETRLDSHATRLDDVEQWQHDNEVTTNVHFQRNAIQWSWRRRAFAVAGSIGLMVATVFGPYLAIHLHF